MTLFLRSCSGQRRKVKFGVREEGDIDIAVYFQPDNGVEWETFSTRYEGENRIALDLERLLGKEIDLVVLNRAKSVLADEIMRKCQQVKLPALKGGACGVPAGQLGQQCQGYLRMA